MLPPTNSAIPAYNLNNDESFLATPSGTLPPFFNTPPLFSPAPYTPPINSTPIHTPTSSLPPSINPNVSPGLFNVFTNDMVPILSSNNYRFPKFRGVNRVRTVSAGKRVKTVSAVKKVKTVSAVKKVKSVSAVTGLASNHVCAQCGTTEGPQWRSGPNNTTLCNAHGLSYQRQKKIQEALERQINAMAQKQLIPQ